MRHLSARLTARLSAALVLVLAPSAFAELVTNGDFESPSVSGAIATYTAVDSTSLTGWTVTSGSVDHIGNYWVGADGGQSIDLNGSSTGQIQQTLTTVAGQQYTLKFALTANPDGGVGSTRTVQYDVGSGGGDLSGTQAATVSSTQSLTSMEWAFYSFNFIASGTSTLLSFTSLDSGSYGPVIDDVSVFESPEPGTFLLFGLGLGGLGFWRRTQKRKTRAKTA